MKKCKKSGHFLSTVFLTFDINLHTDNLQYDKFCNSKEKVESGWVAVRNQASHYENENVKKKWQIEL